MELHVISHPEQRVEDLLSIWSQVEPWVDFFHLRFKEKTEMEVWEIGKVLLDTKTVPPYKLLVNSHTEVARQLGCGGVHLPESALVSNQPDDGFRWGRSVHSVESAIRAEREGADYIMFGHIFSTPSKQGLKPRGLEALTQVVQAVRIPVIAVGGIHHENVQKVMETGCAGVAVISALGKGESQMVVQELKRRGAG
ncbi:thiamine phosphate synthase [Thermoflavimicrobium dichotomicum]|uniref:Thiazole tautomerase (Transcriptional regulator TenI) n=1 Tax=Thermoflavimicrobium dichotomicum TaxID=46223 RepID=A0A1I3NFE2_9BACL|nr:thiamine phosphate synthase [Thermoflavimicrobium dichotomicum]SFJ08058.1 thiazole tautomerase (transcriptional regulator TenI) [Thermoflavimicrobium dichotomicum]